MLTSSIVTFHTPHEDLKRLIECVAKSSIEILFIIDNSSNDELRLFVQGKPRIRYIHSINLGYGSGHNVAIRQAIEAGSKYHVILNPDLYWEGNVMEPLIEFMDNNLDCGLVMPKIIYPDGKTQFLCKLLPTPIDLIIRRFIPFRALQEKLSYNYELHWSGYDKIMEIPSLSGCFMFIRCNILKDIGGFDERYFMYAEDLDLCRRIGEVSKTFFYPFVSVVHKYEKGSYKNRKLLRYHLKSIFKYFNKWGWFFDSKRRTINKLCIERISTMKNT